MSNRKVCFLRDDIRLKRAFKAELSARGLNVKQFATMMDSSPSQFYNWLSESGSKNSLISQETLIEAFKALGFNLNITITPIE